MTITKLRPTFTFDQERLDALAAIAPEAFADGKVNWEALREALGDRVEDEGRDTEHFGLFWPGKRNARRLASTPSAGTLRPAPGEGVNEATTRHLFIEGDNLEVLKLLQKSYAGRVKMIYIDPPYNTGNDFIYSDNFTQPLDEYLRASGQADEIGRMLVMLFHLLDQAEVIQDMHFMLQKEVVARMAAPPGDKTYGRLSLMLQIRCQVQPLFIVGPGAFRPAPQVESALVRLIPHPTQPYPLQDPAWFAALVAQAFSQRRKTLGRSLRGLVEEVELRGIGIDPVARPEQVSVAEFVALANATVAPAPMDRPGHPSTPH